MLNLIKNHFGEHIFYKIIEKSKTIKSGFNFIRRINHIQKEKDDDV
jgi:hypothetical protein